VEALLDSNKWTLSKKKKSKIAKNIARGPILVKVKEGSRQRCGESDLMMITNDL
jgi:hypothetical protein